MNFSIDEKKIHLHVNYLVHKYLALLMNFMKGYMLNVILLF